MPSIFFTAPAFRKGSASGALIFALITSTRSGSTSPRTPSAPRRAASIDVEPPPNDRATGTGQLVPVSIRAVQERDSAISSHSTLGKA